EYASQRAVWLQRGDVGRYARRGRVGGLERRHGHRRRSGGHVGGRFWRGLRHALTTWPPEAGIKYRSPWGPALARGTGSTVSTSASRWWRARATSRGGIARSPPRPPDAAPRTGI